MKAKKLLTVLLVLALVLSVCALSACKPDDPKPQYEDTLQVGYSYFSNKFSPFFSKTSYDQDVASMTQIGLLSLDRAGNVVLNGIEGETRRFNNTDYKYTGCSDATIVRKDAAGNVIPTNDVTTVTDKTVYTFKMKEGMKFADGKEATIDDAIFTMYALIDPDYDGSTTLSAIDIVGSKNYQLNMSDEVYKKWAAKAEVIIDFIANYYATEAMKEVEGVLVPDSSKLDFNQLKDIDARGLEFTQADYDLFCGVADKSKGIFEKAMVKYVQSIIDYCVDKLAAGNASIIGATLKDIMGSDAVQVAFGMAAWGFAGTDYGYREDAKGEQKGFVFKQSNYADAPYKLVDGSYVAAEEEYEGQRYFRVVPVTETENNKEVKYVYVPQTDGIYYKGANGYTTTNPGTEDKPYKGRMYTRESYVATNYSWSKKDLVGSYTGKTWDMLNGKYPTPTDYANEVLAARGTPGHENLREMLNTEAYGYDFMGVLGLLGDNYVSIKGQEEMGGVTIDNVEGIKRIDDYTVEVTVNGFDAVAIYQIGVTITPLHYYGDAKLYDYNANKFGFTRGDLSAIRSKTTAPMGGGAYKFVKYTNGVVTFEANPNYFKGQPLTKYINFVETSDAQKYDGVKSGKFDVTNPSMSVTLVKTIKQDNGNDSLEGSKVVTKLTDFLGYGYIGICARNVKVGNEYGSEASINLRKGFMTALAYYRAMSVNSYYGDLASVINYPISNTSWAAPQKSDGKYVVAFSKDIKNNDIYTGDADISNAAQRVALKKACLEYFQAAGIEFKDLGNGNYEVISCGGDKGLEAKLMGDKPGYEIIVPGDGTGDHPSYTVAKLASDLLKEIGITLTINDPTNSNVLWNKLDASTQEMWAAAWGATVDPDMNQIYKSTNTIYDAGGQKISNSTGSNHYYITDANLDKLIMDARKTDVRTIRTSMYFDALTIVMNWAVELPVYQRKDGFVFNPNKIDMSTITPDLTTYWGWMAEVEL
ncbi:MAG: ABC transporter substrate-binding protein, partial [Clostridia bacterium]